ncbi:MAG: hypothetical protein OEW31_03575 [Thermoleophilia bacterium]|nr:hypothetical protein [Thermoleophilia bacterium]MDH4345395.1 hypothetical protein [Thermoleophilia bacterium]
MPISRSIILLLAAATLAVSAGASATVKPTRIAKAPARVTTLALSGKTVAYATAPTSTDCFHVELWRPAAKTTKIVRFGEKRPCGDEPSTGFGISGVSVATTRAVWVSYAGGNLRDWQLWTATTSRRTPRRLRFVERDVEDPAPILVGAGTPGAIPFAVDAQITLLADNGKATFKTTMQAPVRMLAGGVGPLGLRVGALLADGTLWRVFADGHRVAVGGKAYAPATVKALRVGPSGIGVQVGATVEIDTPGDPIVVSLPAGATMVDLTATAVLAERAGDLLLVAIAGGSPTLLVDGTTALPARGQLEPSGLAWARGLTLFWRPGAPG